LQPLENIAATAVGQAEVQEHGIKGRGFQLPESVSSRFRLAGIEAGASQAHSEDPIYGGIILDDQYLASLTATFVDVFSIQSHPGAQYSRFNGHCRRTA